MTRSLLPRWHCDALPIEGKPRGCRSGMNPARECLGHAPTARIRLAAKVLAWQSGAGPLFDLPTRDVEDWLDAAAQALHEIGEGT